MPRWRLVEPSLPLPYVFPFLAPDVFVRRANVPSPLVLATFVISVALPICGALPSLALVAIARDVSSLIPRVASLAVQGLISPSLLFLSQFSAASLILASP